MPTGVAIKNSRDELEDAREIRDLKIQEIIREGYEEYLTGKTRPNSPH